MSISIKTDSWKVKDENGQYRGTAIFSSTLPTEAQQIVQQSEQAITAKGAETLASIPSDYTDLSNEVDDLKSTISDVSSGRISLGILLDNIYINSSGEAVQANNWHATDFIEIPNGVNYLQIASIAEQNNCCAFYNSLKEKIGDIFGLINGTEIVYIPENALYFRLSATGTRLNNTSVENYQKFTDDDISAIVYGNIPIGRFFANTYIQTSGSSAAQNNWIATDYITIPKGLKALSITCNNVQNNCCAFYDSSKAKTGSIFGLIDGTVYVSIPQNAVYFRLSFPKARMDSVTISGISAEKGHGYVETQQPGYLYPDGTYKGTTTICSITRTYNNIKTGDKIIYRGRGDASSVAALLYKNGSISSTITGDYRNSEYVFTASENLDKIVFSSFATGLDYSNVYIWTDYIDHLTADDKIDQLYLKCSNYLYGKKWVACGDSFTAGNFTGYTDSQGHTGTESDAYDPQWGMYKTYPWWIARRNGMQLINEAVSGSTMALPNAAHSEMDISPFSDERYTEIPADADYITLWFDINDQSYCDVGAISDSTNATTYGAWNVVMEYLIEHHPWAKIGIIVTNGISGNPGRYAAFEPVARDIAKKWGVGYLDLQQDYTVPLTLDVNYRTGLSDTVKSLRNAQYYVSDSNHHPNLKAHEYQSTFIENWLRSL